MNELRKLFYLLLIIPILFINTGCSEDDEDPVVVNESEVLVKYLEDDMGDFTNTLAPVTKKAEEVNAAILANDATMYVIDIRSATDYAAGHIKGAVNVALKDIVTHYESNNLASKTTVVIACYSGQTAGYATALLRLLGYSNTFDLFLGMCSWNDATAGGWKGAISNGKAAELSTTAAVKNAAGDLPVLSTGKTTGEEILRARITEMLSTADPFGDIKVSNASVFANLSGYYIANYWSETDYNWGHIPGAVQYTPKADFKLAANLKTLPTNKPVVVYCYTGTTSAFVATYLKVLGYDAKTLLYGMNALAHDTMPGTKFDAAAHVHNYELVQ
ncbi:MAG: rhodanese-like domain-containing protein [Ignavibacteriae bacterium]|nr:rhodanese-like domain-containing protein [Ignavibacteriota bacterium]